MRAMCSLFLSIPEYIFLCTFFHPNGLLYSFQGEDRLLSAKGQTQGRVPPEIRHGRVLEEGNDCNRDCTREVFLTKKKRKSLAGSRKSYTFALAKRK